MHVLNTVGESIQAEAQEQIKKEKQKTGVQVNSTKYCFLLNIFTDYLATITWIDFTGPGIGYGLLEISPSPTFGWFRNLV